MLGSQTQKVLQHATIPVLVSAVESNLPPAHSRAPLAIIRDTACTADRHYRLARVPALAGLLARCAVAVSGEFAGDEVVLPAGAEVALLPPVSGG